MRKYVTNKEIIENGIAPDIIYMGYNSNNQRVSMFTIAYNSHVYYFEIINGDVIKRKTIA